MSVSATKQNAVNKVKKIQEEELIPVASGNKPIFHSFKFEFGEGFSPARLATLVKTTTKVGRLNFES